MEIHNDWKMDKVASNKIWRADLTFFFFYHFVGSFFLFIVFSSSSSSSSFDDESSFIRAHPHRITSFRNIFKKYIKIPAEFRPPSLRIHRQRTCEWIRNQGPSAFTASRSGSSSSSAAAGTGRRRPGRRHLKTQADARIAAISAAHQTLKKESKFNRNFQIN